MCRKEYSTSGRAARHSFVWPWCNTFLGFNKRLGASSEYGDAKTLAVYLSQLLLMTIGWRLALGCFANLCGVDNTWDCNQNDAPTTKDSEQLPYLSNL